jgi:hypothetical protein
MARRANAPLVHSARLESRAAAEYYVLFRLAQMGFIASPATSPGTDLVACSPRGTRVALLQVRIRDTRGRFVMESAESERAARNRAFVFVEFPTRTGDEPVCFVVPATVVAAELKRALGWPSGSTPSSGLEGFREAWHLLGLARAKGSASPVTSPSSPAA